MRSYRDRQYAGGAVFHRGSDRFQWVRPRTARISDYATGSLLVLPATTPTPGFFTVLTPTAPAGTAYVTLSKNRPLNVTWFVNSGSIPSTDFVTVFAEPVGPTGAPAGAGTRVFFKKAPSQDPYQFSPRVSICPFVTKDLRARSISSVRSIIRPAVRLLPPMRPPRFASATRSGWAM